MHVLVYGGTGSQGSAIVARLLARDHQVTAVTRTPEKAAALAAQGVRVVQGDMNDADSLRAANQGIDAVALTITFGIWSLEQGLAYAQNAIDAAKAAGVRRIVYNAIGPVLPYQTGSVTYDLRPRVIEVLAASGIPYVVFQPGIYTENLLGPWTRAGIIERGVITCPIAADEPIAWLPTADLAALMVAAIEHSALVGAQFPIGGLEHVTGTELAARFTRALGREIRYEALSVEDFGTLLDDLIAPGAGAAVSMGYAILRDNPRSALFSADMGAVLEALPVPMTTLDTWLAQMAPLFAAERSA